VKKQKVLDASTTPVLEECQRCVAMMKDWM